MNLQVGQRVRWKILEEMPFVADVMVNIAVESKPCPAMSSLRPQEDIEQARFIIVWLWLDESVCIFRRK